MAFRHVRGLSPLIVIVLFVLLLAGCGGPAPAEEAEAPEPAPMEDAMPDSRYNQSPMLNQRVMDGTLPPVDERLPLNPVVITPRADLGESVGKYGGTLAVMAIDPNYDAFGAEWGDGGGYVNESLATFDLADRVFTENIAESWSVNDELTELTVNLREGVRWSDGNALTTDDIDFWWNDIMLNETLTPSIPAYFKSADGEPMVLNVIDDYTFSLQYSSRYAAIADRLSSLQPWAPKAYLTTWHPDYSDNAAAVATDEGFAEWYEAFLAHYAGRAFIIYGPDRPILGPYIVGPLDSVGTRLSERNPFYWKVDSDGNQLPYIDYYERVLVGSREILEAKAITGDYNFGGAWADLANYPLLQENAEAAGYTVRLYPGQNWGGSVSWAWNYTSKDPFLKELFNDLRWRRAMSLALDREAYNQVFNLGLTEPRQAVPPPDWSFREETMGYTDVEFDPDTANALLDELGLSWDANEEWRTRPDTGEQFILFTEIGSEGHRAGEWDFITSQWRDVGIEVKYKQVDHALYAQHLLANDLDIGTWGAGGPSEAVSHAVFPIRLVPPWHWRTCCALAGIAWYDWWESGGEAGEEPPEVIQELYGLLDEWQDEPIGTARYKELGQEMVALNEENHWWNVMTSPSPGISHAIAASAVDNSVKNLRLPEKDGGWWLIELLYIDE